MKGWRRFPRVASPKVVQVGQDGPRVKKMTPAERKRLKAGQGVLFEGMGY